MHHKDKTPPVGVRKATALLEESVNRVLDAHGVPREFLPTTPLPPSVWRSVDEEFGRMFDELASQKRTVRRLSLDKVSGTRARAEE